MGNNNEKTKNVKYICNKSHEIFLRDFFFFCACEKNENEICKEFSDKCIHIQ